MAGVKHIVRQWAGVGLTGALVGALIVVWACDTPLPTYAVQSTTLRLIPDTPSVSSAGGSVFVVLEFSRAPDAGPVTFTAVVQTFGAGLSPLAGETLCPALDAGALADAAVGPPSAEAEIPGTAFRTNDNQVNTSDSAVTVRVAAGDTDVLVVGAAYEAISGDGGCSGSPGNLLAFGTARISRVEAGAEQNDAEADATQDAGADENVASGDASNDGSGSGDASAGDAAGPDGSGDAGDEAALDDGAAE